MNPGPNLNRCKEAELTSAYALRALSADELAEAEIHIASCPDCRRELDGLRPVLDSFVCWPTDVLRPTTSLQERLALRLAAEPGRQPMLPPARHWSEREWEQLAPGVECMLLAADGDSHRISMLLRLASGASFPEDVHATDIEELHLLDGELWIDERKLVPGDYARGAPVAGNEQVWSETGCTCVLVTGSKGAARE